MRENLLKNIRNWKKIIKLQVKRMTNQKNKFIKWNSSRIKMKNITNKKNKNLKILSISKITNFNRLKTRFKAWLKKIRT